MMYRLTAHHRRYDNFPRLAIFPVRDANFVQVEDEFSCTPLNMFIPILDCSVKEHSGYLQMLLFLRDTFRVDDVVGMAKNK
jgi:hypothetical protein